VKEAPTGSPSSTATDGGNQLKKGLKQRHLTMLALGGVIGAGLFVGSSAIIADAGPLAFVSYGITGIIVFLVMRMLGEMAAAKPTTGSFTDYAHMGLGRWAGFTTGWLYWYFWVILVGFEAVVCGQTIQRWFPDIPVWATAGTVLVIMTLVNLMSVGTFGEAEYWFASIKVAAIIVFIAICAAFVVGLWPGQSADFSNLTAHGGLLPNGVLTLFTGVVAVVFSMTGVEVATIAAAESEEPVKAIRRAVNSVVFRILAFFILSMILIVIVVPWNTIVPGESPFVTALDHIGVPATADLLNLVIVIAALSVLNTGMYTASRMLFVMGNRGDAPKVLTTTNKRGVPVIGILSCTVIGYGCVALSALFPEDVFDFLINSSGAVFLFVYLMICLSELKLRRKWEKERPEVLVFRMWLYPYLPAAVTIVIAAVLISMLFRSDLRIELLQGLAVWAILSIIHFATRRRRQTPSVGDDVGEVNAGAASALDRQPQQRRSPR